MRVAVLQIRPRLCWSRTEFESEIDSIVGSVVAEHDPDLVVFPECMGLWLMGMEATTLWRRIWSWFLPGHSIEAQRVQACITKEWDEAEYYEMAVNLQFSRPPKRTVAASSSGGLLSQISEYSMLSVSASGTGRSRFAETFRRGAEWLMNRLPFRFLAKRLRSKDELEAYQDGFSAAARKHEVYVQAGSLFVMEERGVKNQAYVYGPNGELVTVQEKIHPIPFEIMLGILPGSGLSTFEIAGVTCGVAICYDVNFPNDHVQRLADAGCRFLCCPSGGIVPTHLWKWDFEKDIKEATWIRSQESDVWIGRSYNAGDLIEHVLMFQGIASITAPTDDTDDGSGIVGIVPEDHLVKEHTLVCDVT
jgi:predicted amidohydrolase